MPDQGADRQAHILDTREGYDRWAPIYDTMANWFLVLEQPEVERALGPVRGLDVLDVGCGTGRHTLPVAEAGARVTGVDFSEEMLARLRSKPGAERVRLIRHDLATTLPFADRSFDRVLSALVLEHIADLHHFFGELRRVVRDDGWVVVSAMHPAMFLRGISAAFVDEGGEEVRPRSYPMTLSDYVMAAVERGLVLREIRELSPDEGLAMRNERARKWIGWPAVVVLRLVPEGSRM